MQVKRTYTIFLLFMPLILISMFLFFNRHAQLRQVYNLDEEMKYFFQSFESTTNLIHVVKSLEVCLFEDCRGITNYWTSSLDLVLGDAFKVQQVSLSYEDKWILYQALVHNNFFSLPYDVNCEDLMSLDGTTISFFNRFEYEAILVVELQDIRKSIRYRSVNGAYGHSTLDKAWNIVMIVKSRFEANSRGN